MKKVTLLLAIIAITFVSCKEDVTKKIKQENLKKAKVQNKKLNRADAPVIEFYEKVHDFGEINEGDIVETTFKFKNTGKSELVITKIKASCGCTVPSNWSREPLMPGQEGEFTVKFNSKNKPNSQSKTITVTCNTNKGKETVKIKAFVKPDPAQAKIRAERAEKRKKQREERLAKQAKEKAAKENNAK
ncbi:MAG TPA: DUF1573 domain-containing protein [Flavobacteriaceae bacterium]|nr:DUF1573 domain-containing protein [Flavobacteriaceae bacterium]HIP26371.1 DUF1573 domain-containing protein [Flavobacteriaceae bacterium]